MDFREAVRLFLAVFLLSIIIMIIDMEAVRSCSGVYWLDSKLAFYGYVLTFVTSLIAGMLYARYKGYM